MVTERVPQPARFILFIKKDVPCEDLFERMTIWPTWAAKRITAHPFQRFADTPSSPGQKSRGIGGDALPAAHKAHALVGGGLDVHVGRSGLHDRGHGLAHLLFKIL